MIIGILGPTASGKTALSIEIAKEFGGEIVSADSVAVYKGFDIGSAKPDGEERRQAVFHLVDCIGYNENYSVGEFQRQAHGIIDDIGSRGKLPIVCGGSGLYAKAALEGLDNLPETTPEVREKISRMIEEDYDSAVARLEFFDPLYAEKCDLKNPRRVARALEIIEMTGKAPSLVMEETKAPERPPWTAFCLTMEREKLIERINRRVDLMVEAGLFEETENLLKMGADRYSVPMSSIGYRECADYLFGDMTKDEAIERIKISTRQFAKRQYTWFRKYSSVIWVDTDNRDIIKQYIKNI